MVSVNLDRENRGKVNAVRRVPVSSSDKGNLCMHENTGHLYTRRVSSGSLQDFFNICSDVTYVPNATELTTLLLDDTPRILTLGAKNYQMPSGPLIITAPKVVVGKATGESILKFTWDPGRSLYDLYINSESVWFHDLTLMRTQDDTPNHFVFIANANNSGFNNCYIGGGSTNPTENLIKVSESDYVSVNNSFFNVATTTKDASLLYADNSDHIKIDRCVADDQVATRAIKLDQCDYFYINRSKFSNHSSIDSNAGIDLSRSDHGSIENTHINIHSFSGLANSNALRTATTGGTYCKDVRINSCSFTLDQGDDYTPVDVPLVSLWGDHISASNSYVYAQYMGKTETLETNITSRPVIMMRGDNVSLQSSEVRAANCRCAILVDANDADLSGANGAGTRIRGNYIGEFGMDHSDTNPGGANRIDSNGILLTDIESVGATPLPCSTGVIAENVIVGDPTLHSTAITGCPHNDYSDSVHALYWAISNNVIYCDPPSGAQIFGIKTTEIDSSVMLGNLGAQSGAAVLDYSEGTNNTSEYGSTNDTESTGANI